ncbi:MAG: potassium channel family protein [Patescibacteria group bacterium]
MNHIAPRKLLEQRKFRFLLIAMFVIALGLGLLIVPLENNQGNIKTPFDGLWWAVTTLTTVGYGDYVPVTFPGKILGIVLQLIGAIMFGLLIAMMGSTVNRVQDEFYWRRLFERFDRMEKIIDDLMKRSDFLVKSEEEKSDR